MWEELAGQVVQRHQHSLSANHAHLPLIATSVPSRAVGFLPLRSRYSVFWWLKWPFKVIEVLRFNRKHATPCERSIVTTTLPCSVSKIYSEILSENCDFSYPVYLTPPLTLYRPMGSKNYYYGVISLPGRDCRSLAVHRYGPRPYLKAWSSSLSLHKSRLAGNRKFKFGDNRFSLSHVTARYLMFWSKSHGLVEISNRRRFCGHSYNAGLRFSPGSRFVGFPVPKTWLIFGHSIYPTGDLDLWPLRSPRMPVMEVIILHPRTKLDVRRPSHYEDMADIPSRR